MTSLHVGNSNFGKLLVVSFNYQRSMAQVATTLEKAPGVLVMITNIVII